jgi:GTP-binding protein LepA
MDLPNAIPEIVEDQIIDLTGCDHEDIIHASGKTGMGVETILERIIQKFLPQKEISMHHCRH